MILIVTNSGDITVDYVIQRLADRKVPFARLNTDDFPKSITGAVQAGNRNFTTWLAWPEQGRRLEPKEVQAVWYRRPVPPPVQDSIRGEGVRRFASDECYEFLRGIWYSLDCLWVSPPEAIRRSEHKIVQLKTAIRLGFNVPRTLVTNCANEALSFWHECNKSVVAKPLYLGFIQEPEGAKFIYTSRLTEQDIAHISDVAHAPVIFQQQIDRKTDIRITVVGNNVFAASIHAGHLPDSIPDWRYCKPESLVHQRHDLPAEQEALCVALVQELGLRFGAIDMALDQEGTYHFFEINPNGQWAWIERAIHLPISNAIADLLEQS